MMKMIGLFISHSSGSFCVIPFSVTECNFIQSLYIYDGERQQKLWEILVTIKS